MMFHKKRNFLELEKSEGNKFYQMELNIPENGLLNQILDKEEEFKYGLMVHIMKDIGLIQKQTKEVDLFTQMVMFMKDYGRTIKLKEKVNTNIMMMLATLVNGKRISSMELVMKLGLMVLSLKVNTVRGRNMV